MAVKPSFILNIGRVVLLLNKIIIMGRMVRDPELRHTQSGTSVASFTLAVDRDFKDKATGERAVDFIDCTAWRGTAEFVSRYLTKGRMAVVDGRLQIRHWEDKDGNKRYSPEVVAESVYFADSKRDPLDKLAEDADPVAPAGDFAELSEDDGELPF